MLVSFSFWHQGDVDLHLSGLLPGGNKHVSGGRSVLYIGTQSIYTFYCHANNHILYSFIAGKCRNGPPVNYPEFDCQIRSETFRTLATQTAAE